MTQGIMGNPYARMVSGPLGQQLYPDDSPNLMTAGIDPGTSSVLSQDAAESGKSDQDISAQTMRGVDGSSGLMVSPDQMQGSAQALGGAYDGGMAQALANHANRYYQQALGDTQRQADFGAPMRRANVMSSAASGLMAQQGVTNNVNAYQMHAQQQQQALRNAALNSALGGVGAIAGKGFQSYKANRQKANAPAAPSEYYGASQEYADGSPD